MASQPSLVVELGEPFLRDVVVCAREGLREALDEERIREIEKLVVHHGGQVRANVEDGGVTHALLASARGTTATRARARGAETAHPEWVRACVHAKRVLSVDENVLYRPPETMEGVKEMRDCVVCVTGYAGARRRDVETMTRVLGGKFQKAFDRSVTHLVTYEFAGAKWERARDIGSAYIVNHRWLEDSIRTWTRANEASYASRSGKEEDELAAQGVVPDSEDEVEDVANEVSVIPDSLVDGTTSAEKWKSTSDANTLLAVAGASQGAPSTVTKKTPSTVRSDRSKSASKSRSSQKLSFRSPDWEEEVKRGAHVARSARNRIDPSIQRALQEGTSQPEAVFTGLIGSPNDVEMAFGGRFAPANAWFSFFDDADQEPLTDMTTLDDFYALVARGQRSSGDTEEKMRRIKAGETRFDVFDMGISEAREEEVVRPGSGLIIQTLYSGTVVLVSELHREYCEEIVQLVDTLEMQQQQGPLGSLIHAMLRVETAKQPVREGEQIKPGPNALLKTFLAYLALAHNFSETDQAQLFNGDGTLVNADTIITLPARAPGNLRGILLKEVQRSLRDVLAGLYELLAGPTEPDPTQQAPLSQHPLSQLELEEEENEEQEEEEEEEIAREEKRQEEGEELPHQLEMGEADVSEPAAAAVSAAAPADVEIAEEVRATSLADRQARRATPEARPTRTRTTAVEASTSRQKPVPAAKPKKTAKVKKTTPKVSTRAAEAVLVTNPKAHITLSGFSSAGIKKYSSIVRRIGAVLCPGHEWEPSTTHVVFGERGSRSIKFLAGAVSGASLLDISYLDACASAGEVLPVTAKYIWRGGRGAEMGVISSDAAAHWSNVPGASAFDGLSIAILPFAPSAKLEQKMLDTVLRAGGASLSSVSSKGDVCLTQADVADFVVSDQVDASSPAAVPRLEPLLECGGDVVVVSPEFFKSWVSTPETALDAHLLFGRKSLPTGAALEKVLALRGKTTKKFSTKKPIVEKSTIAPPAKVSARKKPAVAVAPPAKATEAAPKKVTKHAAPAPVALSQRRQTRAKKMSEAPLAARVAKRRRVLRDASNN